MLPTCLKTPKNTWKYVALPVATVYLVGITVTQASASCRRHEVDGGTYAGTGLPRRRRRPPLPSLPRWARWTEGVALDGGAAQAHRAARDGAGCLTGRSSAGRAGHAERRRRRRLILGGSKEERAPYFRILQRRVGQRCSAVRGLEQL
jgi:hypothetical protein